MTIIGWNAIVKNEATRILRAAQSVAPYINCAVIHDTGSDDGTPDILEKFFASKNIPCRITRGEFHDFSQARNDGLKSAWSSGFNPDYWLLMDADMELVVKDATWLDHLDAPSYLMYQVAGTVAYQNARLLRKDIREGYLSPTHEYLNVPPDHTIPREKAFFNDYADGTNRVEKFKRDIKLLKAALKEEPNNPRYMYYLAQSYRDAGKPDKAAKWYKKRVEAGGWDQEVWSAQYCYAHCLRDQGDEAGFIREALEAYNLRPSRIEPLYDLARMYRERGNNYAGAMFAEMAMNTPPSTDALFVNDYVQTVGAKEEFSICGFYVPWKRPNGYRVANWLSLYGGRYANARDQARSNMFHYVQPLSSFCPSFTWSPVKFTAPEGYVAMNPSLCSYPKVDDNGSELHMIVRTVNYRINEHGQYLIRGTDGTCNATNPIHTRNFMVKLSPELEVSDPLEITSPAEWGAPAFPLVVGCEDCRLYHTQGYWWVSATVRELRADGLCEQVRARIGSDGRLISPVRMEARGYEKNWMPIMNGKQEFMYRCNETVDGLGKTLKKYDLPIDVGVLSGGTQLINVHDGWLCMVHEARYVPDKPIRYYMHRFVAFDRDFKMRGISLPFFFHDKQIEYAAGMAIHPDGKRLVFSYGYRDSEARVGTVNIDEVERLLFLS